MKLPTPLFWAHARLYWDSCPRIFIIHLYVCLCLRCISINVMNPANVDPSDTPLLKLPLEIKREIWVYCVGGRMLHVEKYLNSGAHESLPGLFSGTTSCWRPSISEDPVYCPCILSDSETALYNEFMRRGPYSSTNPAPAEDFLLSRIHHEKCGLRQGRILDLQLLQTCKTIYHEARYLPFETNIFSILEVVDAKAFAQSCPPQYRPHVRRLHSSLSITLHDDGDYITGGEAWHRAILDSLLPTFPNVTHLNLSLTLGLTACWLSRLDSDSPDSWMKAVQAMYGWRLSSATVYIGESIFWCNRFGKTYDKGLHEEAMQWPAERRRAARQDVAERLVKELLASNKAERIHRDRGKDLSLA